jgi:hypothetical protein
MVLRAGNQDERQEKAGSTAEDHEQEMTPNDFRRIALGMDGAMESAHMGHPDFRANGKIFATLHADLKWGMVTLTPDQRR